MTTVPLILTSNLIVLPQCCNLQGQGPQLTILLSNECFVRELKKSSSQVPAEFNRPFGVGCFSISKLTKIQIYEDFKMSISLEKKLSGASVSKSYRTPVPMVDSSVTPILEEGELCCREKWPVQAKWSVPGSVADPVDRRVWSK